MNIKRKLQNWLLNKLLVVPDINQVITFRKDNLGRMIVNLGGEQASDNEVASIKEEIKFIEQTHIWQIYQNTLAEQARQKMFEKSESWEDMYCGKMMLYNLEIMRNINEIVKSWKKQEPIMPKPTQPIVH